ncbi:MAG: cysteine rich repeat-containing protein [Gammaproteobacteria bacterium]
MTSRFTNICILLVSTLCLSLTAMAQETGKSLAEKMKQGTITINASVKGCGEDVKQHCPGLGKNSGKIFMCLSAYEAQLTPQCKQGILEATLAMKTGIAAVEYSISACEADADKHCLDVQPGEGRLLTCIKANESQVSQQCITALKDTGLWERVP